MISGAQIRQAALNRVARRPWELDITEKRVTHDALIPSLIRYGMLIAGPCCPGDTFHKVDTRIANIAARQITGQKLTTRKKNLHFVAAAHSFANMYLENCGEALDRAIREQNSAIRDRLEKEERAHLKASDLKQETKGIEIPYNWKFQYDFEPMLMRDWATATWLTNQYKQIPQWDTIHEIP